MTTAESLHYSRDHWHKQFNDCLANSVTYEGRVERGEICTKERAAEVMASQRDRIFYAHVNRFAMAADPLRINGISFGVMLDDAKKKLRAQVDDRFKKQSYVDKLKAAITDQFFHMRHTQLYYAYVSASSLAGRIHYGMDFGEGRDEAVVRKYYYREGGRRFGKTAGLQRDKLFINEIASIGEKGRELYGSWPAYPVDTKVKTNGLELDHIVEDDDERFALYDAVAAIRKRNGYYDPWYLKAWKKITAWIRVK